MKRFLLILTVVLAGMALPGRAQDVAVLEERVKRLTGYVQDLQEKNDSQQKQIAALVKELAALRESQQNQPAPTTSAASQSDLRELAKKVQEIEEKRKADRAFLEKEFERLAKVASARPAASSSKPADTNSDLPRDAREHTIAPGDTLLAIALAYSKDTGRKVTTDLILKANPGLKPERLIPGDKIIIPIPDK